MNQGDARAPALTDVGVIALVPEAWDSPWRARHQVMPRLARYFNVVWMQPPLGWRECWLGGKFSNGSIAGAETAGFKIYDPCPLLPQIYNPESLAKLTERWRLEAARANLRRRGAKKIVLYLWRPQFAPALDLLEHDLSLYHIVDEYNFSETEVATDNQETRLIARAGQVIVHSPALMDKKGSLNPSTVFLPNGVNYASFATPHAEPADMRAIPHPRVGYVGVLKKEMDLQMLLDLSRRHEQWSFVFVGPIGFIGGREAVFEQLRQRPNAHFLGAKPVNELGAYNQHLDVAVLCYENNAFNNYIFPLKLNEYLASGCPIVGTGIKTLEKFGHVVDLVDNIDEWSAALQRAVGPGARSPERVEQRQAIARSFDWDRIVDAIAGLIGNKLGADYTARVHAADGNPRVTK